MSMKYKRVWHAILCVAVSVSMLAGCGNAEKNMTPEKETAEVETSSGQENTTDEAAEKEEAGFAFSDVSNLEFYFSSGAGGWCTVMYIHEDGTFDGQYHDSDMGDIGDENPNGTMYFCDFKGKFAQPQKVDDYTYSTRIESIEFENEPGDGEIIDGVCYIYTEAYGLDEAEEILIYLPGIALDKLPEEYRSWVGYYDLENTTDTTLPFYGLYNVTPQCGFSSYECVEDVSVDTAFSNIDDELAGVEEQAQVLEEQLRSENLTQIEMNETSAELYRLWDDELNLVWSRLKETLDDKEMSDLLTKQREWISYKESEVAKVGAEYGEGSMRALAENDKAAELTKERVYELAEMLR